MLRLIVIVALAGTGVWSEPQRSFPTVSAPFFSLNQPYFWYLRPQQQEQNLYGKDVYQEATVETADKRSFLRPNKPDPITELVVKLNTLQSNIDRFLSQRSCPKNELEAFGITCFSLIQSCYCRIPLEKSVNDANDFCKAFGFDGLVSLQTKKESQIVTDMFNRPENGDVHWTSGSDARSEGNFIWSTTGERVIQSSWIAGEPDGGTEQNCVYLDVTTGTWATAPCVNTHPFICEWGQKTLNPLT